MPRLAYRSPLSGAAAPLGIVGITGRGVRLIEKPLPAMIELRGDPNDERFINGAAAALGFAPPLIPCTSAAAHGWRALWSRPDGWLLVGPQGESEAKLTALKSALAGIHHVAVDVSHRAVVLELSGDNARRVLAKGCPLDLHPRAFKAGNCARTILTGQPVLIHALSDAPAYDLYIEQGLARALWLWFKEATREYAA
ncbi:MAG: sarcosine oxidase subunit gamma [Proteobacteria bacterium]|nr:MAG: sarcosine oxidase subunit gamma [Pseudomonadota bacterium]